jgi:hypothetical protein
VTVNRRPSSAGGLSSFLLFWRFKNKTRTHTGPLVRCPSARFAKRRRSAFQTHRSKFQNLFLNALKLLSRSFLFLFSLCFRRFRRRIIKYESFPLSLSLSLSRSLLPLPALCGVRKNRPELSARARQKSLYSDFCRPIFQKKRT